MPLVEVTYAQHVPDAVLLGPFDRCGVDVVVEVRSKWFASRADNRQDRGDRLCASIEAETGVRDLGVYLSLPVAAWSQSE